MAALREAVLLQMRLRGFAANTVDAYLHAMEELWRFFKRPLERLTCEEVQRFLDEIITVRKRAWAIVKAKLRPAARPGSARKRKKTTPGDGLTPGQPPPAPRPEPSHRVSHPKPVRPPIPHPLRRSRHAPRFTP